MAFLSDSRVSRLLSMDGGDRHLDEYMCGSVCVYVVVGTLQSVRGGAVSGVDLVISIIELTTRRRRDDSNNSV